MTQLHSGYSSAIIKAILHPRLGIAHAHAQPTVNDNPFHSVKSRSHRNVIADAHEATFDPFYQLNQQIHPTGNGSFNSVRSKILEQLNKP